MANSRRSFLHTVFTTTAVSLVSMLGLGRGAWASSDIAGVSPSTGQNPQAGAVANRFLEVRIRGDLRSPPINFELVPGRMSDPIDLGAHGVFRVSCTPTHWNERYNRQVYSLVLADANGKQLGQMNIGSGATATFMDFGIQVNVLAIEQTG
ncbi:MAG TPA: hypothetical protein VGC55_14270 [Dokdonella sp.]